MHKQLWAITFLIALTLSACSNKAEELSSPCAGIDGSPCVRRPVNDWWTLQPAISFNGASATIAG